MRNLSTLTTAITTGVATLLFAAGPVAGQESPPNQERPPRLFHDDLQEVNPGEQEPEGPPLPPSVKFYTNQREFLYSCPEGYERVPKKLEEDYGVKPPAVLCVTIPPGSLKQSGEPSLLFSTDEPPTLPTPASPDDPAAEPRIELPPGLIAVGGEECPEGYEEIPNGADLYGAKVGIPGFRTDGQLTYVSLTVCREIAASERQAGE
jgi:hypothetical protein